MNTLPTDLDPAQATRDPLAFLSGVTAKLGYYVYALRDPRNGEIFYVGKGQGDRVYQHARHAKRVDPSKSSDNLKLGRIRQIHASRHDVGVEIFRHRLSEDEALEVEAAVIDGLKAAGVELTNVVAGRRTEQGWQPLDELVAKYAAKPIRNIPGSTRLLLIRITEPPSRLSERQLYKRTREWWRVSPRRKPDWAFSVYDGVVWAVYRIDGWQAPTTAAIAMNPKLKGRWRFRGARDPAMEKRYFWKDVSRHLPRGARNPIRYVNC